MTETTQDLMTPKDMLAAMPAGAVAIEHRTGETWNDGGHWHTLVVRLLDNTHIIITMDSDYNGDMVTSQYNHVPSLEEQLADANRIATDQAAEIARLREALEDAEYDLAQWVECAPELIKAGFNMDGSADVLAKVSAALEAGK